MDTRKAIKQQLSDLHVPLSCRKTWVSYLRFQVLKPAAICRPRTLMHLRSICKVATENGMRVRAIGRGHSFSRIGVTKGLFIETRQMDRMLRSRGQLMVAAKKGTDTARLVEFEVGRTIIKLSKELERQGLALPSQGTYDGQTFWGAVSTSTHGSGLHAGPFPDMVRSIVLVGEGGTTYRIEPTEGLTEPTSWSEAGVDELIQDDDVFWSVVCSFGCMGVVYSVIAEARDFYWLDEWSYITTWEQFSEQFSDPHELKKFVVDRTSVYLLVAPSRSKKDQKKGVAFKDRHPMAITLLRETTERKRVGGGFRDRLAKALEHLGVISSKAPAKGFFPTLTDLLPNDEWIAKVAVAAIGRRSWNGEPFNEQATAVSRRNKCYRIFPKGGKLFGGFGLEVSFPMERTKAIMDKLLKLAAENNRAGRYHTAPISIRFVKPSKAHASPQFERETVMLEVLMVKGSEGGEEALKMIENAMLKEPEVRLHWGLNFDQMRADHNADLHTMYPEWDRFVATFRKFNSNGTFNNPFTDKVGLT